MRGDNFKLGIIHRKAARLLIKGEPKNRVARTVGVTPKTIFAWLKEVKFTSYVEELERVYLSDLDREIKWLKKRAVAKISKALTSDKPLEYQWAVHQVFILNEKSQPVSTPSEDQVHNHYHNEGGWTADTKDKAKSFLKSLRSTGMSGDTFEASNN